MFRRHIQFNPDQEWAKFYLKYPTNKPSAIERKALYARKLSEEEKKAFDKKLKERDEKKSIHLLPAIAATRIQRYWKKRRKQDNLAFYEQIVFLDDKEILDQKVIDEKTIYLQKDEKGSLTAFSYKEGIKKSKVIENKNSEANLIKKFEKSKVFKKNSSNMDEFDDLLSLCRYSDLFPVNIPIFDEKKDKWSSGGNHSTEFVELVHNQKIKKSINKIKLDALFNALNNGMWDNPIFEDTHLPQLAMSLFASGKITQQQTTTVLERIQNFKDHKHIKTVFILDEKGNFTDEAQKILIPALYRKIFEELDSNQLKQFQLLVSRLPKSEQIFYITNGDKYTEEHTKIVYQKASPSLGMELILRDTIYKDKNHAAYRLINLSAGARDALGITRFGLQNYIRMVPTLGEKTPKEIEQGVRQKKRYGALDYPGMNPIEDIHGWTIKKSKLTRFEATSHDIYHSNIMSEFSVEMQDGILTLVDIVRNVIQSDLGTEWSKEIWDWIDCDFLYFHNNYRRLQTEKIRNNDLSPKEITRLFCDALMYGSFAQKNYILPKKTKKYEYFNDSTEWDKRNITPLGVIFILDVLKRPDKWKKHKIDFGTLPGNHPIKKFYQEIDRLYPKMLYDDPKIQVFKILLYQNLKNNGQEDQFQTLSNLISESKELIGSKLKFKKITKQDVRDLKISEEEKNSVYLSFDHMRININPEKNSDVINKIVEIVAKEKVGNNKDDIANFKKAILELHYNKDDAIRYVQNKKNKSISEYKAQFLSKPTVLGWAKLNPKKSIFSLYLIPLFYGFYKAYQQDQLNQRLISSAVSESETSLPVSPIVTSRDQNSDRSKQKKQPTHDSPSPSPHVLQRPPSITQISIFSDDKSSTGPEECLIVGKIPLCPKPHPTVKSESE